MKVVLLFLAEISMTKENKMWVSGLELFQALRVLKFMDILNCVMKKKGATTTGNNKGDKGGHMF